MSQKQTNKDRRYIAVDVFNQESGKYQHAGYIFLSDKYSGITGFSYADGYDGPPLDPASLPINQGVPKSQMADKGAIHGVFKDTLPGSWGLMNISAETQEYAHMTDAERLFWLGSRTSNGLQFRCYKAPGVESHIRGEEKLKKIAAEAVEFKELFDKDPLIARGPTYLNDTDRWAIVSEGGAKPKAKYMKENTFDEVESIAKFTSPVDGFNSARVEAALFGMSAAARIETPEAHWIEGVNEGMDILLVDRFDRTEKGPIHKLSVQSLMGNDEGARFDARDVVEKIKEVSADPKADSEEFFKRMVFAGSMNITNNHLKNFEMMVDDKGQYRLSPNFDLEPDMSPSPFLTPICGFGAKTSVGFMSVQHIDRMSEQFGINREKGRDLAVSVLSVVKEAKVHLKRNHVSNKDIESYEKILNLPQVEKTIKDIDQLQEMTRKSVVQAKKDKKAEMAELKR